MPVVLCVDTAMGTLMAFRDVVVNSLEHETVTHDVISLKTEISLLKNTRISDITAILLKPHL
jgi:hypothetical protein